MTLRAEGVQNYGSQGRGLDLPPALVCNAVQAQLLVLLSHLVC